MHFDRSYRDRDDSRAPVLLTRRRPLVPEEEGPIEEVAPTRVRAKASVLFFGGRSTIELFESESGHEKGGVVLRIRNDGSGDADDPDLAPVVKSTPNGVEVHLPGTAEAGTALALLRLLLQHVDVRDFRRLGHRDLELSVSSWIDEAARDAFEGRVAFRAISREEERSAK